MVKVIYAPVRGAGYVLGHAILVFFIIALELGDDGRPDLSRLEHMAIEFYV